MLKGNYSISTTCLHKRCMISWCSVACPHGSLQCLREKWTRYNDIPLKVPPWFDLVLVSNGPSLIAFYHKYTLTHQGRGMQICVRNRCLFGAKLSFPPIPVLGRNFSETWIKLRRFVLSIMTSSNPRYWPFVSGINWSPVNSPHKGQWRGALIFLWSAPESTVEWTIVRLMIWDAITLIMTSL